MENVLKAVLTLQIIRNSTAGENIYTLYWMLKNSIGIN